MSSFSPLPPPEACQDMGDVRAGVDLLDRELVGLLAIRQRYMDAAARIKADRGKVYDADRIEDVIAKVKATAGEKGLSPSIAEPLWRVLVELCIAHELESWDRLREDAPAASPST